MGCCSSSSQESSLPTQEKKDKVRIGVTGTEGWLLDQGLGGYWGWSEGECGWAVNRLVCSRRRDMHVVRVLGNIGGSRANLWRGHSGEGARH